MKLWRNDGFRRETASLCAIWAVFAILGFLLSPAAGLLALGMAVAVTVWHVLCSRRRYRLIAELADELDRILHGRESFDLDRFSEGELSILQSELSKLIVALRQQSDTLLSDKKYLANSLADISHQLKTPLTSINLALAMLASPEISNDRREELVRDVSRSLTRLEWLVSALLKMSRLDAGMAELSPRRMTVRELVDAAVSPLLIALEVRMVELRREFDENAGLTADPAWMAEALGNILKNCMEHTPAGGRITVSARENAVFTEIAVVDTGPGFDREDLPHIFERFYRGQNADVQSAGIGLALARAIVQSAGGTVRAENAPGGGARFVIRVYKGAV